MNILRAILEETGSAFLLKPQAFHIDGEIRTNVDATVTKNITHKSQQDLRKTI